MSNELRNQLRDTDPLRDEPPLTAAEVYRIRRHVVAVGAAAPRERRRLVLRAAIAAGLVCIIGGAMLVKNRLKSPVVPVAAPRINEQRQLQFTTPGGTRIIWVLDPNFQL